MNVNGSIQFSVVEQTAEKVVGEMPVQAGILNPFGIVHAGATLWFADVCATVLAFGGTETAPDAGARTGDVPRVQSVSEPSAPAAARRFQPHAMQPGVAGFPLAISLNAALLGNQKEGVLRATAVFVKKGRRLSVVRTTVTGQDGRLIADVTTSHVPA
ncbi:MAG: PaaI family thioesterase [Panacagrimonas sp.]